MALEYFTLTGRLNALVVDYVDMGVVPDVQAVTCTVDIIPRLPDGEILWAAGLSPKQGIALSRFKARFDTDGQLKTIVGGVGVQLLANTAEISLDQLIYDLQFSNVVYNRADQAISPRAFVAPITGGMTVDMADLEWIPPRPGLA